ncbi:DsbA family protein [Histidinibacterium lentulum]|uniref:DsbA family protein n=1 Tax=Histidinibacterium lentulum TaxID=2480588 RepID=A0A3N2R8Y8_9RHOB|nr:DsbA family protein [Histidinibacterium lentulum]ROU03942.1 DsbA family protein [Histidinibacterium lentulum]
MTRSRLAALALAASLATPAAAFDLEAMTDAERAAFRAEVRAYLLDNPEVLMEAIGVLEQREAMAQAEADRMLARENREALWNDGHSWVGGNPDGDVTIVEFVDYRCGFCRRAHPEVEALLEQDGNIRLIMKEYPILGESSLASSQFAIAVKRLHGDAAYKDVHDALISLRADATPETLAQLAEGFGFEPQPILDEMGSVAVAQVIEENRALAQRMQISGTPTFVVGDELLRGYLPAAQMQVVVDEVRASSDG